MFNEAAQGLTADAPEPRQRKENALTTGQQAWQAEKKQLLKRIARLEAQISTCRPTEAAAQRIKTLEEEVRRQQQTLVRQERALKAAAAESSPTSAQIANLTQQLQSAEKQLAQQRAAAQSSSEHLQQQLAERQQQLQALQARLERSEQQRQQEKQHASRALQQAEANHPLQTRLSTLQQQYQTAQQEADKQRARADKLDKALQQLNQLVATGKAFAQDVSQMVKTDTAPAPVTPHSDAERDSYALGQFLATHLSTQVRIIRDAGIPLVTRALNAGLTTRLSQEKSALDNKEMEARYRKLDEKVSQGMGSLIARSYKTLQEKIGKRKALKQSEGMHWFTVKPAKSRLKAKAVVTAKVKMTTLNGEVINDFSQEQLTFDRDLPPLLYEGLSLTGPKGEVEGWALAQDIFDREALPEWVVPYDIIHYQLTVR
ncbi:hypothetical protein [[Erwinia] mediterraneensis]|uniref:hypothetical protein n=1 Tax=[Erwinia] mediterraneensis TaxID=2161819 RepID=UPI0013EF5BAB|nr:hypothetical protein [[Erwinia] mediterraneensis]